MAAIPRSFSKRLRLWSLGKAGALQVDPPAEGRSFSKWGQECGLICWLRPGWAFQPSFTAHCSLYITCSSARPEAPQLCSHLVIIYRSSQPAETHHDRIMNRTAAWSTRVCQRPATERRLGSPPRLTPTAGRVVERIRLLEQMAGLLLPALPHRPRQAA